MFFVAGTVAVETGKTKISQLDGMGKKMPWEFGAFTLAVLSMVGLPPMAGFIAKWYLSLGVGAATTNDWWILLVLIGSSVLNLAYFLPVITRAFFRPSDGTIQEVRWTLRVPVMVTAAGALLLGIWTVAPYSPFALCAQVAANVTHTAVLVSGVFSPGTAVPPFLIFLVGAPLVLLLKDKARQIGLIALGGLALVNVMLLPGGYFSASAVTGLMQWNLPIHKLHTRASPG